MEYWVTNSPALVRVENPSRRYRLKFYVKNDNTMGKTRIMEYYNRGEMKKELKTEWRFRSIEERHHQVVDWCKYGDDTERLRHQSRLKLKPHLILIVILIRQSLGYMGSDGLFVLLCGLG